MDTKSGKLVERRLEHENGKVGGRTFDVDLNFSVTQTSRRLQVSVAFQVFMLSVLNNSYDNANQNINISGGDARICF